MVGDDTHMAAYIGPDSWAWLAQAHDDVRQAKINAIKPETGQGAVVAARHMRAYREAGFTVEVMVMAVPAAMSNQGIVSRYYEQVVDSGHGRLTVQANADRAYGGILDLADEVDADRLADYVMVVRRGEALPRYHNELTSAGDWKRPPSLRASIEQERARPWTEAERASFRRTDARLREELGPQWEPRLDEIVGQAQPYLRAPGATVDVESDLEADVRLEPLAGWLRDRPAAVRRGPGSGWHDAVEAHEPEPEYGPEAGL